MKPPIIRTSLSFAVSPDNTLITFSRNVHSLLYAMGEFTDVPVTAPELLTAIDSFAAGKAAQPSGGKAATAAKNNQRDSLLVLMKELALYVQVASANDPALLLSSGFETVSLNRTRYPLSKPVILRVVAGMSGESLVTISTESISRGCEIRVAPIGPDGAPGVFRPAVFSTTSRNVPIGNLTPGNLFAFQGRTMGGSTTYSDWSDLIVQRAA